MKYLFYALMILAIYFMVVGFYRGNLTGNSTVSEVAEHVTFQTESKIKDGFEATKEAIQNDVREIKTESDDITREVESNKGI